jgi:hypothetical protein
MSQIFTYNTKKISHQTLKIDFSTFLYNTLFFGCEWGRAEKMWEKKFCDSNLCGEVDGRKKNQLHWHLTQIRKRKNLENYIKK